jgi:hypothetical protein
VAKLKRSVGANTGGSANVNTAAPISTTQAPATPRGKTAGKKTSAVKPKRARAEMEEDVKSEDTDESADCPSPAKKRATPRRSVTATRKSYKEENSDEDDSNTSAEEASGGDQDEYLTSARATSRTVDFGIPKADSAVSNVSTPSKISQDHSPAALDDEVFRPADSIARPKYTAPRPYDFFNGMGDDDNEDAYIPLD